MTSTQYQFKKNAESLPIVFDGRKLSPALICLALAWSPQSNAAVAPRSSSNVDASNHIHIISEIIGLIENQDLDGSDQPMDRSSNGDVSRSSGSHDDGIEKALLGDKFVGPPEPILAPVELAPNIPKLHTSNISQIPKRITASIFQATQSQPSPPRSLPAFVDLKVRAPTKLSPKPELQNSNLAVSNPKKTAAKLTAIGASLSQPKSVLTEVTPATQSKSKAEFSLRKPDVLDISQAPLIFDIPITYNSRVRYWLHHFQTNGASYFRNWLERSSRYLPFLQYELAREGLPQDLAYIAMVESGFSSTAASHAGAVGMWQFILPTANRYGLKASWWLDERVDFAKATTAAIRYMRDLHRQFGSWYLVAASYNMGENGVRRLIRNHKTANFWELADRGALPAETTNYVPKILAAILISKAPALYGFRGLNYQMPMSYEYFEVPGGTDIIALARFMRVSEKYMRELNPELLRQRVPQDVVSHKLRIPKGSLSTVALYVRSKLRSSSREPIELSDSIRETRREAKREPATAPSTYIE
jgi:membrane-bound lytic murein transglycosylase D